MTINQKKVVINKSIFNEKGLLAKVFVTLRLRVPTLAFNKYRWAKGYVRGFVHCHLVEYPTPICLSYAWSFGSLAGVCLVIQFIMRDVPNGVAYPIHSR